MTETQQDIQEFYRKIVESELGSIAGTDEDGDIFFNVPDAGRFYILLEDGDPSYFRMGIFNIISRKSFGVPLLEFFTVINEFNRLRKVTKHWAREQDGDHLVCITIEAFLNDSKKLPDEGVLRATIERCFAILNNSGHELAERLGELSKQFEQKPDFIRLADADPIGSA
ncbi:hypothetical protein CFR73_02015 [Novacetimonas maltaceti]|uniref:YbjN domain-containing protein n=1 Tax=Novacetimonas maltaceti TaxID=1203393 RepID=A0A2S3W4N2_9PROT|nr:hypothetical protein [Novacetimonas maltaceti]POF63834.1 hypothetical protein KMAL_05920 [Novacetimonas maltaceti]PYD61827.1 hypothetical protein CFR73_02015 [Novacetimonas maltaceti]